MGFLYHKNSPLWWGLNEMPALTKINPYYAWIAFRFAKKNSKLIEKINEEYENPLVMPVAASGFMVLKLMEWMKKEEYFNA